ncbi:hypothetical protein DV736_g1319, partial [Chaetothyriales sp. CBS 134916]
MVKYLPPPDNLDGLNPIQRFMQRESTLQDYFYLALFVLCYIAARPSIKKGAEWLLASPEYKEGVRKQKEFEQARASAKIGANTIRSQKATPAQLLDSSGAEGEASAVQTAATSQVQNRKTKSAGTNKSEVDKLIDWDDEPARTKQKGDTSDVVAWLDKWNSTPKPHHVDLSASLGRWTPSPADEAAYKSDLEKSGAARDYNKMRPRIIYDNLPARKIHAYDPADNAARRPGLTAARSSSPASDANRLSGPGQPLQRTRLGANGMSGHLLQRSRSAGQAQQRAWPGSRPSRGPRRRILGSGNAADGNAALGLTRRLRITNADEEDTFPDLSERRRRSRSQSTPSKADQAAFEREVSRLPSDNPTTVQAYNPVPPSLTDLEKYWPNTPLSPTGLRASVSQQLAPLANRQTTGFWTPLQLAQQYVAGQFVSLHSEREKDEMMKFVPRLLAEKAEAVQKYVQVRSERDPNFNADAFHAKRKAARLPDTNTDALPQFVSLIDPRLSADAGEVVTQMVRGRYEYPSRALDEAKWGKMKWIGEAERKLTVNGTYGPGDRTKFLGRLADMVKEMQQGGKARTKKQKQVA